MYCFGSSTVCNGKRKTAAADLPYGHDDANFRELILKIRVNLRNLRQMGLKTPRFFGAKRSSSTTVPETLRFTQGDNLKGELRKVS